MVAPIVGTEEPWLYKGNTVFVIEAAEPRTVWGLLD
jgi:hypothetical protein